MRVDGKAMRTVWTEGDGRERVVAILDQARLPHELVIERLSSVAQVAHAIRSMQVRGAPLIGATAAYGVALAMSVDPSARQLEQAVESLASTRPTAPSAPLPGPALSSTTLPGRSTRARCHLPGPMVSL